MNGDGHTQAIRVLLAEQDESVRDQMRQRLAAERDIEVVGVAGDGERAVRLATQLQPDVAVLSLSLPRLDGIAATETISISVPFCQVIVLSEQGEISVVRRAMIVGAREFLLKPVNGDDLVAAVHRVHAIEAKRRTGWTGSDDYDEGASAAARQRLGRVTVIWGPKGGVGRTFLAVNCAAALAGPLKQHTLLIDGALPFGSVDIVLDLQSKKSLQDLMADGDQDLDPDLVARVVAHHSSGLDVLLAPPADTLLLVSPLHVQRILAVTRRLYSHVIIDTHPSLDETTLAFLDLCDTIVAVATPELTALRNLRVFLATATRLGYGRDKISLVINRADMRNAVPLSEIEAACRREITLTLPNDHDVVDGSINKGKPLVIQQPDRPVAKQLIRLAGLLAGEEHDLDTGGKGRIKGLARLLGRQGQS